KNSP
ncbi:putative polymorphic outer membrane protein 90A, partial [Chlamydia psittaci 03DC29]